MEHHLSQTEDPSTTLMAARKAEIEREVEALVYDMVDKAVEYAISVKLLYKFPSGVPGFGNCILGPRVPRVLIPAPALFAPPEHLDHMEETDSAALPTTGEPLPDDHRASALVNRTEPFSNSSASKKRKRSLSETKYNRPKAKRAIRGLRVINPVPPVTEQRPAANNDDGDGSEESDIARLVQNLKYILHPYTQLHATCDATEPMTRIYHALSARTLSLISIMSLMTEAVELLKALRDLQASTITKFSEAERVFLRVGLESFFYGTRATTQQIVQDIQDLEKWIRECDE